MAEGGFDPSTRPKIKQLCRYFIHGACDRGDNCRFVHDKTGTVQSNSVCKFYQQGRCSYGSGCRYDHIRVDRTDYLQERNPPNTQNGRQRKSSESSSTEMYNGSNRFTNDSRRTRNDSDSRQMMYENNDRQTMNNSRNRRSYGNNYRQTRNDSDNRRTMYANNDRQPRNGSNSRQREYDNSDRWTRNKSGNWRTRNDSDNQQTRNDSEDTWNSSMVTLKKNCANGHLDEVENSTDNKKQPLGGEGYKSRVFRKNWAKAKDFIPGQKYHAGATYACKAHDPDAQADDLTHTPAAQTREASEKDLVCPYYAHGHCPYGADCNYIHGEMCDICQMPRLHPTDLAQREEHTKECLKEMEKDMEHSFAIQESQKKECCICLEIVLEKTGKEPAGACKKSSRSSNQFGILENCTHCFCLDCIRRWRSDKMSFGKNVRVCPICRVHSDFVTPSSVWVEEEAAKKKVIQDYKDALRLKPCQYFKQGKGDCPFNEKCFYKHAYPDGTIAKPKPRPKRRRQINSDGELSAMEAMTLWDFLEVREDGLISLEDELSMYLLGLLGDSDEDDSDYWMFGGLSDGYSTDSSCEF